MEILKCFGWAIALGAIGGTLLSWLLHLLRSRRDDRQKPTSGDPTPIDPRPVYSPEQRTDQLEAIEGIGSEIAEVYRKRGIRTFADLANSTPYDLKATLTEEGPRFDLAQTTTWPQQARLIVEGDILGFLKLINRLKGGVEPTRK